MTKILCASPPRGQFIQPCFMPHGTPDVLVGDRAWWRAIRDEPAGRVGYLEAWGEGVRNGSVNLTAGADIEQKPHTAMLGIEGALKDAQIVFADEVSMATVWHRVVTPPGVLWIGRFSMGDRVIDAEVMLPYRAPYALAMAACTRTELSASGIEEIGRLHVPGFGSAEIRNGVLGQGGGGNGILRPDGLDHPDPETAAALENATILLGPPAMPAVWTGDYLGVPLAPFWSRTDAIVQSGALAPRDQPDNAGVDPSFGCTVGPVLYSRDGAVPESWPGVIAAAEKFMRRPDSWVMRGGSEIPPYPGRPDLSFDRGYPWAGLFDPQNPNRYNDQNDPRDTLGHDLPRGRWWPQASGGILPANHQHDTCAALATAALATNRLDLRMAVRRKAIATTYQRGWWAEFHSDPAPWMPAGRGRARPSMVLYLLSQADSVVSAFVEPIMLRRLAHMKAKILALGLPLSKPALVPTTDSGWVTAYEEGLDVQVNQMWWRWKGWADALWLAHRGGRYLATTCFDVGGQWQIGYYSRWDGTGNPMPMGTGQMAMHDPDRWMCRWHLAGLHGYLAACAAMAAQGLSLEADDPLWAGVAQQVLGQLHSFATNSPDNAVERSAYVNQGLPGVSITALATPIAPVGV